MTDAVETQRPNPLTPVPAPPAFERSRKSGYIEDVVDAYVSGLAGDTNRLIEAYNTLTGKYYDLRDEKAAADSRIAELEAQLENASSQAPVAEEDNAPAKEVVVVAPVAIEEAPVNPSSNVEEIEAEAAERSAAIFREAQGVARKFVEDARTRADGIVNSAEAEATRIREDLNTEVTGLVQERDHLIAESDEVVDRIRKFHESQLAAMDETTNRTVGYSPTPSAE